MFAFEKAYMEKNVTRANKSLPDHLSNSHMVFHLCLGPLFQQLPSRGPPVDRLTSLEPTGGRGSVSRGHARCRVLQCTTAGEACDKGDKLRFYLALPFLLLTQSGATWRRKFSQAICARMYAAQLDTCRPFQRLQQS